LTRKSRRQLEREIEALREEAQPGDTPTLEEYMEEHDGGDEDDLVLGLRYFQQHVPPGDPRSQELTEALQEVYRAATGMEENPGS